MSVTAAPPVRTSLSPVELPLLTLQLLTQLQYDRDTVKSYYESCKRELNLHKQKCSKETVRCQQTTKELQSEVAILDTRANSAMEAKNDLELQLEAIRNQLKTAQERLSELETLFEQRDNMLEKPNEASKVILLQTKENLTTMLCGEDVERLLAQAQDLMEVMHNKTKLFEARDAAEQHALELLDRVKSLEENVEHRSRMVKTFQKYLKNLTLIQDDILKEHSQITTVLKHHKSEIIRIDTRLSNMFQNFSRSYKKYKEELLKENLKKLLNGKYKEDVLLEAGKSGKFEDISLLLHFKVDTEVRDSKGKRALHLAAENGHLRACEVLLDGGSRIEAVATGFEGNTPIILAAWKGHLDIVRLFAERGTELSPKNRNGDTPLTVARRFNHDNVAKFLEENGATV